MRRLMLMVVVFTAVGLTVGAGCREQESAELRERAAENPLTGSVSGTVARAFEGKLQLHEADGKRIVLSTDDRTQVARDGQPVALDALQPGTAVRASYVIEGNVWMARQVDVLK